MADDSLTSRMDFKLYVVGYHFATKETIKRVKTILNDILGHGEYRLEVIDVITSPEAALQGRILATPALVRCRPTPEVRVIGHVGSADGIFSLLEDTNIRRSE